MALRLKLFSHILRRGTLGPPEIHFEDLATVSVEVRMSFIINNPKQVNLQIAEN